MIKSVPKRAIGIAIVALIALLVSVFTLNQMQSWKGYELSFGWQAPNDGCSDSGIACSITALCTGEGPQGYPFMYQRQSQDSCTPDSNTAASVLDIATAVLVSLGVTALIVRLTPGLKRKKHE